MFKGLFKSGNNSNSNNISSTRKTPINRLSLKSRARYDFTKYDSYIDNASNFINSLFYTFDDTLERINNSSMVQFKNNNVYSATKDKNTLLINSYYVKSLILWYFEYKLNIPKFMIENFKKDKKLVSKVLKKTSLIYINQNYYFTGLDTRLQKGYLINTERNYKRL